MNSGRILIIDDEAINIEILVGMLNEKYELKVAYDGLMGINIAKKVLPDLIILDIEMPKLNGFEVALQLKNFKETKDIPIIFVTAKTQREAIIAALNSGAVDYISKPYFKEELMLRISNHLKTSLLQKELNNRNKIQEQLLIQQSKLASMGEMVGAIAHQWRQPLTVVEGILINIEDAFENNDLTKEYLTSQIDNAEKNILYMSKTIDDFRNFFIPSKEIKPFCIIESIINSLQILNSIFVDNSMKIDLFLNRKKIENYKKINKTNKTFLVNGYKNEFSQVIINILNNAKDAILEKEEKLDLSIKKGKIIIDIFEEENLIKVKIKDNGAGVAIENLNRIFEPYFTTKEEGKGTGIGLYMSKTIIEKNMKGILSVSNYEDGSVFEIIMKKYESGKL